jgi:hypothetical protein
VKWIIKTKEILNLKKYKGVRVSQLAKIPTLFGGDP